MRIEAIAWFDMPNNGKWHGQNVMPQQELIRCKDCRYWDWMPASTATPDYHLCRRPFQKIAMTEYDFCSYAERKEE